MSYYSSFDFVLEAFNGYSTTDDGGLGFEATPYFDDQLNHVAFPPGFFLYDHISDVQLQSPAGLQQFGAAPLVAPRDISFTPVGEHGMLPMDPFGAAPLTAAYNNAVTSTEFATPSESSANSSPVLENQASPGVASAASAGAYPPSFYPTQDVAASSFQSISAASTEVTGRSDQVSPLAPSILNDHPSFPNASQTTHSPTALASKARKYPCLHGACGMSFSRSNNRKRHEETVHGTGTPVRCRHCGKSNSRADNLKQHMLTCKKRHSNLRKTSYESSDAGPSGLSQ